MSDSITAIIPKDSTFRVNEATLELARKTVVRHLIKEDYDADKQVNAELYEDTELFYEAPEDIFSEYDWMHMHCNHCRKDLKAWWYQTVEQLPNYNRLQLPCPCGKAVVDLNQLVYGGIELYFVRFSIRIWNITGLLTEDDFKAMMDELEQILGCGLQTTWGRY